MRSECGDLDGVQLLHLHVLHCGLQASGRGAHKLMFQTPRPPQDQTERIVGSAVRRCRLLSP